jgi:hypothetical protein
MELLGLLWLIGVTWAMREAGREVAAGYRASRAQAVKKAEQKAAPGKLGTGQRRVTVTRHAAGWWGREALHGFPVTRAGLHHGWLAHKTALAQGRARREEARTSHLEAQASVAEELPEHRRRQDEARERIERAEQTDPGTERLDPDTERLMDQVLADGVRNIEDAIRKRNQKAAQPAAPAAPHPQDHDGKPCGCGMPACRSGWQQQQESSPREGNRHMATEGTYTQSIQLAQKVEADAEAHLAERPWEEMENHVDAISALMRGDTATLSDYAEVADALKDVQRAWQRAVEAAQTARANLQQRHGGIKQASDDAPVPMAEAPFYED